MRLPQDIILKPYITEKSNMEIAAGKYTFIVDVKSTKTEVKKAVEALFSVKVIQVNTMNYDGKIKRTGVHEGPRPAWKKAIVKIDINNPKPDEYLAKGGKSVSSNKKYKTSIEEFGVAQ
jgi:large subunit ribosomal protein L23